MLSFDQGHDIVGGYLFYETKLEPTSYHDRSNIIKKMMPGSKHIFSFFFSVEKITLSSPHDFIELKPCPIIS
jgi:hypothetical protein